jgi:uncharacterized protein YcfJ
VSYQERWRLAIALKRAAPSPYDVGDVMAAEPAATPAAATTKPTASRSEVFRANLFAQLSRFPEVWDQGKAFIVSGTALGLILGGLVGFRIGKGIK